MWKFVIKVQGKVVNEFVSQEKSKKRAFAEFSSKVCLPDPIHTVAMEKVSA